VHQYAPFNRFDPERPDMYWLYDEVVERLDRLGPRDSTWVLDFGCGLGQIGPGFALDGYQVVLSDVQPPQLDFAASCARTGASIPYSTGPPRTSTSTPGETGAPSAA
jgi:2-polyprenyl-3-methyl-5-hydroxy-6-metoxy-1,4-benzoquinol methylase